MYSRVSATKKCPRCTTLRPHTTLTDEYRVDDEPKLFEHFPFTDRILIDREIDGWSDKEF